jgi:hypothetical protein
MSDSRFDSDQGPNTFAPAPRFGYEAPGLLSRYKWLAIAFLVVVIAACIYLYKVPHKPPAIAPRAPSTDPVYIDPVKPASP